MNLSACYSCALIPETSCEEYNIFLDRGVLIGTFMDRTMGFFGSSVYEDADMSRGERGNTNQSTPAANNGIIETVCVQHNGSKLSNMSFADIWQYALDNTDGSCRRETDLLTALINASLGTPVDEDPLFGETVNLVLSGEEVDTDLMWERAQVMVFLADNEENYLKAKESNWKCFYTDDPDVTANDILMSIKGES